MFVAILKEDGVKHLSKVFATAAEAKAEGKRLWLGTRFDVMELISYEPVDAKYPGVGPVYEVGQYIAA